MRHDEILGLLHYLLAPGEDPSLTWAGSWELAFWAFVLLLSALLLLWKPRWVVRAEDAFRRISQHRTACVWAIGGAVLAIRTMLLPLIPIPIPVVLDEFSYLLGADTFASGRLTNPPHPMWVHFETFNVNMQPSLSIHVSAGPEPGACPGTEADGGAMDRRAVQRGRHVRRLLLDAATWMPPQWALLGGIYALVRYGIFSYWINSYWGGAVAAIGGALLLGSLPRLRRKLTWQQSIVFVAGLVILANSRPFEGFLLALPLLGAFAWLVFRSALPRRRLLARIVMPCLLLLTVAAAAMLYYNWRGTGNPLQMPYSLNQAAYHVSRPFLFQKPYPIPNYRNPQMRTFYMFHEYPDLLRSRTTWGLQFLMGQKFFTYYVFLVWPLLLLFVPGLILAAGSRELRVVVLAMALLLLGLTVQLWPAHGHYAAPASGAVLLILLNALRRLRSFRNPTGGPSPEGGPHPPSFGECGEARAYFDPIWFSRAIVLALFLWMLVPISDRLWNPFAFENYRTGDITTVPREVDRERLQAQLSQLPGQHLVIVHYNRRDVPSKEWVYNRADIDNSKVVWARDMGPEANQELLRYFATRHVWYVDHSGGTPLTPYDPSIAAVQSATARLPNTP
jgi:hypothetical protein